MLFGKKDLTNSQNFPLAEMFSFNGAIVTCFAFKNNAYFFKNAEYWGKIVLEDSQIF